MSQFKSYFATMPWLAIPPGDKRNGKLNKLYGVRGIPTLVLVDGATGVTINANGRAAVDDDPEGENFPWHATQVIQAAPLRRQISRQMSGRARQMAQGGESPICPIQLSARSPLTLARSSRRSPDHRSESEGHRRAATQRWLVQHRANRHPGLLLPRRLGPPGTPALLLLAQHPPRPPPSSFTTTALRTQYCNKTDLTLWALVFGWAGMGIVIWQFLGQVWFWQINWTYFTTGGGVAQMKTVKRLNIISYIFQAAVFVHFGPPNQLAFNPSPTD